MKYLRMQLLMYYYFRVIGNENLMYKQFMVIYYLSRRASEELKAFGDIRKETYLDYNKKKVEYFNEHPMKMKKLRMGMGK